jgi:hypothetical protein
METTNENSELAKDLQQFEGLFLRVMEGGDLDHEEMAFYQAHPQEWHWRQFHLLMLTISELRRLHKTMTEFALSHATIIPAKELNRIISSVFPLNPVVRTAVDCWETDRDLAYEHFGDKLALCAPKAQEGSLGVSSL